MEVPIVEFKTPWPLVNVEEDQGELVIRFHADAFHWPAVEEVGDILDSLLAETEDSPLVLDFKNVEYVPGVGLEKLVFANQKLQAKGRRLTLRNVAPPVAKLMVLTGLAEHFNIEHCGFQFTI